MFSIDTAPQDGSRFLVYKDNSVAFAWRLRPAPGRKSGWGLLPSWTHRFTFQKKLNGNGIADWSMSGQNGPHPGFDFDGWLPIPKPTVRIKMGRSVLATGLNNYA